MVQVLGRIGNELAYRVMARGMAFEVRVAGRALRVKHLPCGEGRIQLQYLGKAMEEVANWLQLRAGLAACFAWVCM